MSEKILAAPLCIDCAHYDLATSGCRAAMWIDPVTGSRGPRPAWAERMGELTRATCGPLGTSFTRREPAADSLAYRQPGRRIVYADTDNRGTSSREATIARQRQDIIDRSDALTGLLDALADDGLESPDDAGYAAAQSRLLDAIQVAETVIGIERKPKTQGGVS